MSFRIIALLLFLTLLSLPDTAVAADLLQPTSEAPRYVLSNARRESDRFGRSVLAVDFRRTKNGKGSVSLSGASSEGRISISASVPSGEQSGTLRLSSMFGFGGGIPDVELFLVQRHKIGASKTLQSMVSNTVRSGNPGVNTSARPWTAEEREMAAEFERIMNDDSAHKPTKSYPVTMKPADGTEFVPNTAKLTKGTKLGACQRNAWNSLTTISENDDGTVNVRWDKYGKSFDCAMSRGELTIASTVLAALAKHPATKYPPTVPNWASESAKTLGAPSPGAKPRKSYPINIPIPSDSMVVPADMKIKAGVKLFACYGRSWNPLTALGENEDGTLNIRWDKYGSAWDNSMARSELIIKRDMGQTLRENPEAVAEVIPPLRRKSYAVKIPVPTGSQFVPADVKLKPNTKLQACYAGRWCPITFLSHASDGTLNVHWDDYSSGFDCSMVRTELIIRDQDLPKTPVSDDAMAGARTFTDATGRFKVKATIQNQTESEVTLLTEKGKVVTLPISKLSDADQEFLRSTADAVNPFE